MKLSYSTRKKIYLTRKYLRMGFKFSFFLSACLVLATGFSITFNVGLMCGLSRNSDTV